MVRCCLAVDMARHFALKDAIRLVGVVPHYLALPESFDFSLAASHPHISPDYARRVTTYLRA